jgi:hypothetical protein
MDANLTRYNCDSSCECGRFGDEKMRVCDDGEYVKFADIAESLSTSHNTASTPCSHCEFPNATIHLCQQCNDHFNDKG